MQPLATAVGNSALCYILGAIRSLASHDCIRFCPNSVSPLPQPLGFRFLFMPSFLHRSRTTKQPQFSTWQCRLGYARLQPQIRERRLQHVMD